MVMSRQRWGPEDGVGIRDLRTQGQKYFWVTLVQITPLLSSHPGAPDPKWRVWRSGIHSLNKLIRWFYLISFFKKLFPKQKISTNWKDMKWKRKISWVHFTSSFECVLLLLKTIGSPVFPVRKLHWTLNSPLALMSVMFAMWLFEPGVVIQREALI